jgi:type IV pilus assembly protein PilM
VGIFSIKPKSVVGIDISSTAVKLLELTKVGNGYRVESYAMEPLPERSVENKDIKELEIVGDAIRRLKARAKPTAEHAACAVAGNSVITKIVTMTSGLTDNEIRETIEADANQYISFPLEEVNLDFEIIGPNEKEPEARMDVLLAAARNDVVDSRTAAMELGGFKVKVVDVERYALENALVLLAKDDPEINAEETLALVEVGSHSTTIYILSHSKIIYTFEEPFGARALTERIQIKYGLGYPEAIHAQRNGGLPESYETELLIPFKREMAQQVNRMVQRYCNSPTAERLSHVLVSGGCAAISGLVELLNEEIGGHVTIANPFIAMSVSNKVDKKDLMNDAPALLIACGLALRTFDTHY